MEASFCCPVLHDWKHIRARTKFGERKPGASLGPESNLVKFEDATTLEKCLVTSQSCRGTWFVCDSLRNQDLSSLFASFLHLFFQAARLMCQQSETGSIISASQSHQQAAGPASLRFKDSTSFTRFTHISTSPVDLGGISFDCKPLAWELFHDMICPEFFLWL